MQDQIERAEQQVFCSEEDEKEDRYVSIPLIIAASKRVPSFDSFKKGLAHRGETKNNAGNLSGKKAMILYLKTRRLKNKPGEERSTSADNIE